MGRNGAINFTSNDGIVSAKSRTPVEIMLQSRSVAGASGSVKYPFFNGKLLELPFPNKMAMLCSKSTAKQYSYRNGIKSFDDIICSAKHYNKSVIIAQSKNPK